MRTPSPALSAITAGAAALGLALTGTASAAPLCTAVTPAVGSTVTCSYSGTGSTTITVPIGTASLTLDLSGGGGGGGIFNSVVNGGAGGAGARVQGAIDATALGSITVVVGAGGAQGAVDPAGKGGGLSAIYSGGAASPADVIAVAGGGGGGAGGWGSGSSGGAGGNGVNGAGATGNDNAGGGRGGVGGSAGTGGAGGCDGSSCSASGTNWAAGGGGGGTSSNADGDGGAGYGGGGEGYQSGGGAGGSFLNPALRIGSPTFSPGGGLAGVGGAWAVSATAGGAGTVTVTFVARQLAVGYDANGATGGSPPADADIDYGSALTVPGNTGNLVRPGHEFAGWNTQPNGSGTAYSPGASFVVTAGVTLYAQWTAIAAQGATSSGQGAGPATTTPVPAAPARKLASLFSLRSGVGTTTGTVPPGATVMVQTAGAGGGASGSVITQGFLEMAKAKTAKGKCTITVVRNKKTKKVTKRTYKCTIRLSKGTWTVTTTARGKTGVVAEGSRRVVVK